MALIENICEKIPRKRGHTISLISAISSVVRLLATLVLVDHTELSVEGNYTLDV